MYLSFRPQKNTAFRLYFNFISQQATATITISDTLISKDGAQFAATSNAPVQVVNQGGLTSSYTIQKYAYIDLTQAEMNADVIRFRVQTTTNGTNFTESGEFVIIYTTTGSDSGITAADVWAYATRTLTSGGGSVDFDLDDIKKAVNSAVIKFTR